LRQVYKLTFSHNVYDFVPPLLRIHTLNNNNNQTGEKLVNFLVEPKKGTKWPNKLPKFDNRPDAIAVCRDMCKLQYLLRAEKRGKGELGVSSCIVFVIVALSST